VKKFISPIDPICNQSINQSTNLYLYLYQATRAHSS